MRKTERERGVVESVIVKTVKSTHGGVVAIGRFPAKINNSISI